MNDSSLKWGPERRFPLVVIVAIALHYVWGVGLLFDPEAHSATAVHAMMLITNNTYLTADSAQSLGVKWATPSAVTAVEDIMKYA